MDVYYDGPLAEAAARARAACFAGQIALLERVLGDDRVGVHWDDVVFTSQADYAPPRGEGNPTRWIIRIDGAGALVASEDLMVLSTIPHEQTHKYQARLGSNTPRWFREGHATWVGLKVLSKLDAAVGAAQVSEREANFASATEPLALRDWGGVQPTQEAILRQLSPEDRVKFLNDPTFQANGAFTFGPGDLVSDESNSPARYGGAWRIFTGLEDRHGAASVQAWVASVTATDARVTSAALIASAQERFNEDITPLLQ